MRMRKHTPPELYPSVSLTRKERPLLAFSRDRVAENCREFASLCNGIIGSGKWEAFFPLKVACLPELLADVHDNGFGVEVISIPEFKCAQTMPSSPKLLSGSAKSEALVSAGMREGGWRFVVCESVHELTLVDRVARHWGTTQDVLLRLKLTPRRRLGMPPEEMLDLVHSADRFPNCRLVGIHAHPGSNVSQEVALKTTDAIERMLDALGSSGFKVNYVNFGSGLPPLSTGLTDLSRRIQTFKRIALQYQAKVIIEPGRPIVADAACLLSSITEVRLRERQVSINTAAYVLHGPCRADAFLLYRRAHTDEFIRVEVTPPKMGAFRVCGIWPAEGDSLWVNGLPDDCAEGDDLIFPHAGAYALGFLGELSFEPLPPLLLE